MAKTKVDIISGFLGAGKTTFIRKLLKDAVAGEQVVLIENEFGEIGIDGGFLKDSGIEIREMNSGCICCSLVGDFASSLQEILTKYKPDRIIIEPSGVGKLSDVMKAVADVEADLEVENNSAVTVVDAKKCRLYMKNFGEFFNNQVESANAIILSRTQDVTEAKLAEVLALLREHNPNAVIITTPWSELSGKMILSAMERKDTLEAALKELTEMARKEEEEEEHEHHHHHHHDDDEECDDPECECHHHHDDDDEHEHHHHHHHHHGHDADEVFTSWGVETANKYSKDEIEGILTKLDDAASYGAILRAKGVVAGSDGQWIHYDYVPEEHDVRTGPASFTGRICVIGSKLNEEALKALFRV